MNKFIGSLMVVSLLLPFAVFAQGSGISYEENEKQLMPEEKPAQTIEEEAILEVSHVFQEYKDIGPFEIVVPTVVELPLENIYFERSKSFAVLENESQSFLSYLYDVNVSTEPVIIETSSEALLDGKDDTYTDYTLPQHGEGTALIVLIAQEPITASSLSILLDKNVALPTSFELRAGGVSESPLPIIVAKSKMNQQTVRFLETTAQRWVITLKYSQPLRIVEINLPQDNVLKNTERSVRFLAQPEHTYRLYTNPDRFVSVKTQEKSNLQNDDDVLFLDRVFSVTNPTYLESDIDGDGIPDRRDNCVSVVNPMQEDVDGNNRGDACDDYDRDGRINSKDNCIDRPNANQLDTDDDGIGDVCDDEESRVTEKYIWLPWAGRGLAAIAIIIMFAFAIRGMKDEKDGELNHPDYSKKTDD